MYVVCSILENWELICKIHYPLFPVIATDFLTYSRQNIDSEVYPYVRFSLLLTFSRQTECLIRMTILGILSQICEIYSSHSPEFEVLMRFEEGMLLVVIGHLVKNAINNFKICTETSMATS